MSIFPYSGLPGIVRDGAPSDTPNYTDGEWVRFYRGRARKMGGYRSMSTLVDGSIRSILVDSRRGSNVAHLFGPWGIQRLQFSDGGAGSGLDSRTPVGFTPNPLYTWTHGIMASSTGGTYAALVAGASPDVEQLDSDTPGPVYYGDVTTNEPLLPVEDENTTPIQVSGGVVVLQPFLFVYGSNGLIKNSQPNDFTPAGWDPNTSGTFANEANVSGTKFVYGAPVRGGSNSPAGLFWSLDALVRVSFVGGDARWNYDTLTQPTSILSKKCVVEHDGKFFWPGIDRFLMYNGTVQELPNTMNLDWFFSNLNFAHSNKVWGTKVARWGEIWWFFPKGGATECNAAVIYNYRENVWYDAECVRSAGTAPTRFRFPVWAGAEKATPTWALPTGTRRLVTALAASGTTTLAVSTAGLVNGLIARAAGILDGTTITVTSPTAVTLSAPTTADLVPDAEVLFHTVDQPFVNGETITGPTGTGRVVRSMYSATNIELTSGTFANGDTLTGSNGGEANIFGTPYEQVLEAVFQQEIGVDKVIGSELSAIRSSFTTRDFGFAIGAPYEKQAETQDLMTRIDKLEFGAVQRGPVNVTILGRSFESDPELRTLYQGELPLNERFLTPRKAQERLLRVKIESNVAGGFFDQGQLQMVLEPGDARSSVVK